MQNTYSYFIDGQLVYVPEEELDEFMENCRENGVTPEEAEVYSATNAAGEQQDFTVPKSQAEDFMSHARKSGGSASPMTMLTMDDGNRLTLRDEDIRQYVQARRQGLPMTRGFLKQNGIPERYGKGEEDRMALADQLGDMFFQEESADRRDRIERTVNGYGGNIEHAGRQILMNRNADGKIESYSTTESTVVQDEDGSYVVVPMDVIDENGESIRFKTPEEAKGWYLQTGENYGKFRSAAQAKDAAKNVHELHQNIYQKDWNDYIFDHMDEMSDEIRNDPGVQAEFRRRQQAKIDAANASVENPAVSAVKGFGEGLVRSVTDPSALWEETYGDNALTTGLRSGNAVANKIAKAIPEIGADIEEAVGKIGGMFGSDLAKAVEQNAVESRQQLDELFPSDVSDAVGYEDWSTKAAEKAGNVAAMLYKFGPIGKSKAVMEAVFGADGANAAFNTYNDYKSKGKSDLEALTAAAVNGTVAYGSGKLLSGEGKTAQALSSSGNKIADFIVGADKTGLIMGAQQAANKAVENYGNDKPLDEGVGGAFNEGAAEGVMFHAANAVPGVLDAGLRSVSSNERRTAQKRAAEARRQITRDEAKTRYEASLSDEAKADIERNVNEMVKSEVIPSYRQAEEVAKRAAEKLTRETGESAESVQQAVMEAAQEVAGRLKTPSRVETPALERRQTEEKMRENERQTRLAEDYAANEADQMRQETDRKGAEINADIDAQRKAYEKRKKDIEVAFARGDTETVAQLMAEQKAEMDAYLKAESERKAREAEGEATLQPQEYDIRIENPLEGEAISMRESPEYAEWLRKNDRADTDKNWNRYVMENDLDPALKIDRGRNDGMINKIVNSRPETSAPADADALAVVRSARQADLDAAFAGYDAYLAKAEATRKRGSPAKAETPEAIREAVRGDAELQRIDAEYRKAKTKEERDALAKQFKARVAELTKNGKEPAKTDTEPQKLTDAVSENDGEAMKKPDATSSADALARQNGDYPTVVDKSGKRRLTGIAAQRKESADKEKALRKSFIDNEKPGGMMAFLMEKGRLMGKPAKKKITDPITGKVRHVYDDHTAGDALDLFFDGMSDAEKKRWERRLFGTTKNRSGTDTTGDVALDAIREYLGKPDMTIDDALVALRKEYDAFENFKERGGKTREQLQAESQEVKIDGDYYDIEEIESKPEHDAVYDNAIVEVENLGENSPHVSHFSKGELSKLKKGDTIRLDHSEADFTLESYDPKKNEIVVDTNDVSDNPLFTDAEKSEMMNRRFRLTEKGWIELNERKTENGNERTNAKGTDENLPRNAKGESDGDFKLESATEEELASERKRIADRKEIERRQNAPLKTGKGEVGQNLLDLDGAEGEDLFNRTHKNKEYVSSDALKSAQKLLKDKFYQSEKDLTRQLRALPPQAPSDLRAAYETAIAEAKRRNAYRPDESAPADADNSSGGHFRGDVQLEVSNTPTAAKVADPDFAAWADAHNLAHTAENRRTYDTEQMKALLPALKNYRPGTKIVMHENGANVPDGARKFISTDGNVVGYYDKTGQEIHLFPGASVGTVGHELLAHGLWDLAETQANNGNATLINRLEHLANTAPAHIVNDVTAKYQNNPAFAQLSPRELMEEIFASRLTTESLNSIKDEAKRREAAKWIGNVKNSLTDIAKSIMTKAGANKIDLDSLSALPVSDTIRFIVENAIKGKSLAKAERKGKVDMNAPIDLKHDTADRHGALENAVAYHKMYLKDHLAPLQRADKMAGVDNDRSVWSAMTLLPGKVEAAYREAQLQLKNTEKECKKRGIKMSDANEYIKLLAERERTSRLAANGVQNGAGKNRSAADISRDIDALRRKYNQADLDFIQKSWMEFQAKGMDERVAGEIIDMDYRSQLESVEPNHAPLKNRFDEAGDFTGFEDNSSVASPEWHKATGRTDSADGPMQWMMRERVDAALRAQMNVARQRLLAEVQANPEMGTVKRLAPGEASKEMPRKGNQAGKDANTVAVKTVEIDPATGGQSTVTYDIKLRGELGKQMAEALTGRDIMRMSELPGIWGKIGANVKSLHRHWAGAATEYSFTFSGRNAVSDTIEVLFNNIGESAGKTRVKIENALGGQSNNAAVRNAAKAVSYVLGAPAGAVTGTWRDVKHVSNMLRLLPSVAKYSWTGETNNRTINEMIKAGGLIGGGVRGQEVAQSVIDSVERDFKSGKNRVLSLVKNTLKPISVLNQTAEMLNRVADYETERGEGASPESAAVHERKATVDHNEVGRVTDLTNHYKMFSNSTLGSLYRIYESMFKNKTTSKFDPTGAVSMTLVVLAYGMMEAYNEDRMNGDDDAGRRMSDYDRKSSLYIRKGEDIYRLPIHQGTMFAMLKNAGNSAYRYMKGRTSSDEIQKDIAKGTASLICQLAGLGDPSATVMQTLAPSLTQWMVEEAQNKDFANRDIEKTAFDKEKPKSHNGRESTPSVFKVAAEWLNDTVGGGNEARKGDVLGLSTDVSPEMLQHAYRSTTKNAGRDAENTVEAVKMLMTAFGYGDTKFEPKNVPFVRDYFRKVSDGDSGYYDAKNEFEKAAYELKNRKSWKDGERNSFIESHPYLRMTKRVNWIIERIDDLRHYEKGEVKSGRGFRVASNPPDEKQLAKFKEERMRHQADLVKIIGR